MAQDKKSLHLGSARIRIAGRYVGQVSDVRLERDVSKAEHMTNVGLEFRRDHVIPVETRMGMSFTFQEIIPYNANLLFGMPGYRAIPADRRLSMGTPMEPGTWVRDPRLYTEYPTLGMSLEGQPIWSPLVYPMCNPDLSAFSPVSISAQNQVPPNPAAVGYVGFFVTACNGVGDSTKQSIISNVAIVQHDTSAAGDGDAIKLYVQLTDELAAANGLRVWRFDYTWNATYQTYVCSSGSGDHLYDYDGLGVTEYAITAGDVANGYAILDATAKRTLVAASGLPPVPINKVTSWDGATTMIWLEDYEIIPTYKGGAAIKRVPTGSIAEFETVICIYYYDAATVYELPLGRSGGENPVVPMQVEIPFPDGLSKIIIELHRVQVNSSATFALNERDWTGVPFVGDALDAEDLYPDYPYGFWQVMGPLAQRAVQGGNYAVLAGATKVYEFGSRTSWA